MAEHSSIHGILNRLRKLDMKLPVYRFIQLGLIDEEELVKSITPETILITLQHVNSEIGTIQPIEAIAKICQGEQTFIFTAILSSLLEKLTLKSIAPLVSSFSFSGHKIYGPKGIGGVYIDPRITWEPFLPGSSHERGFRPGTLNVPCHCRNDSRCTEYNRRT